MPRWRRLTIASILTLAAAGYLWIAMIQAPWFLKSRESRTEMEVHPALRHCIDEGLLSTPSRDTELKSLDHLQNAAKRVGDSLAIEPSLPLTGALLCLIALALLATPHKRPPSP